MRCKSKREIDLNLRIVQVWRGPTFSKDIYKDELYVQRNIYINEAHKKLFRGRRTNIDKGTSMNYLQLEQLE